MVRRFLFLNLPKITRIIFFFCKCGHKRRLSDGYSHNRWLSDGALWPSDMKNPQKFRGRKQENINEQAALVDTGQVSFQEEEKRKGKMVGGSVNNKVRKGCSKVVG